MLLLRCRLAEIAQSLELYGLDSSVKLNPPRARIDPSERTFESSNYRLLVDAVKSKHMEGQKMSSWLILRAVEELVKILIKNGTRLEKLFRQWDKSGDGSINKKACGAKEAALHGMHSASS